MLCEYFKEKGLVIPEIQNVFTKKLFKTKQISYSDRCAGFSDQETAIILVYLKIKMYLMEFFKPSHPLPYLSFKTYLQI